MDISVQNSSAPALTANAMADLFAAMLKIQNANYEELNDQIVVGRDAAKASADAILESGIHQAEQLFYEMVNEAVTATVSGLMSAASMAYAVGGSNLLMKITPKSFFSSLRALEPKLNNAEENLTLIKQKSDQVEMQEMVNGRAVRDAQLNETIASLKNRDFDTPLTAEEKEAVTLLNDQEREALLNRAEKQRDRLESKKNQQEQQVSQFFQNFTMLQQVFVGITKAYTASEQKKEMVLKAHADFVKQIADWAVQMITLNNQISTALLNSISSGLEGAIRVEDAIAAANRAA